MFKKLLKLFNKKDSISPFPVAKLSDNGVRYNVLALPRRDLKPYSPKYSYFRFKEQYQSLYAVSPLLVERLYKEYSQMFCTGEDHYSIVKNFITGYQILNNIHIVGREYSFDHRIYLSQAAVDQLRIDHPGYNFRHQKGYEGDDYWCIVYTGDDIPAQNLLTLHNTLRSF